MSRAMHLTLATGTPALIARSSVPRSRGIAVVDFRTHEAGSYKWLRGGLVRGHYRVLEVRDIHGPHRLDSHNVIAELYRGPAGIDGVTDRSSYYLGASRERAERIAAEFNKSGAVK